MQDINAETPVAVFLALEKESRFVVIAADMEMDLAIVTAHVDVAAKAPGCDSAVSCFARRRPT